jgi:hypothetical protein
LVCEVVLGVVSQNLIGGGALSTKFLEKVDRLKFWLILSGFFTTELLICLDLHSFSSVIDRSQISVPYISTS